jgi:superfamily II DNA or RNA helicase
MASEGMNIPALNTVLLATPKSNIEQSVGRILRLKPEERTVQPIIMDVLDTEFGECNGQWLKRRKFYRDCGYSIRWSTEDHTTDEEEEAKVKEEAPKKGECTGICGGSICCCAEEDWEEKDSRKGTRRREGEGTVRIRRLVVVGSV